VQYIRAVLRRAFGQAMKWGLVSRNIIVLTEPPRIPYKEVRPLDLEQAKALLKSLEGHQFQALFTVALAMGLRQGEALALRWEDVSFESNELRV
jgi:integrase